MNKFITYIKENKVPLIRNTLIVIATGGAIALVAYVAKSNGEEAEEAAALASE